MSPKKRTTVAAQAIDDALTADPKVASMTLAKRLYKQHPEMWPSLEGCRTAIRKLRGAQGCKARQQVTRRIAQRTPEESEACRKWGALLPEPEPSEFRWHELPEDVQRWLIVADLHVPYHDREALTACLGHAEGSCDGVLILGDGPDAYQLSSFMRDPRKRSFGRELEAWCQVLDAFKSLGTKRVVWKAGNHEYRLERYLWAKAAELADLKRVHPGGETEDGEHFSWPSFCCLEERGIDWIPAGDPIRHHELSLIHGHEWGNRFSSPVNPARGAFLKAHDCTIEAHCHRTSHHVEHTLRERPIACWSIGCLCDLHPVYRPLGNKWNSGFAYLETGSEWRVENHRVINGEVV